jgi:hypothetical protein
MEDNPFAPPLAEVQLSPFEAAGDGATTPPLFAVSTTKLVVLTLFSFGLYEIFWAYWHWRRIRDLDRSTLWPAPRAIFGVLYCYSLFKRIAAEGTRRGITPALDAGPLAGAWVVLTLVARLPDPWWLVTFASFLCLLPVQRHANRINAQVAPDHDRNTRFTVWNWLLVAVGSLMLVAMVIGFTVADTPD